MAVQFAANNFWSFNFDPATVLLASLAALGLYGLIAYFLPRLSKDHTQPNWTPLEAIGVTIMIYFMTQAIAGVVLGVVLASLGRSETEITNLVTESPSVQFLFIVTVEFLTMALLFGFLRRRKSSWRTLGIVRPKLRDVVYVLKGACIYFVAYIGVVVAVSNLLPGVDLEQKQELGFEPGVAGIALAIVFVSLVILPPLTEEILFRGFMYSGLRTSLKVLPAAIITSVLFAAAHLQAGSGNGLLWVAAIDTFVLSLVLVYLREKSGSLWPAIGLHATKNLVAFLLLFVFQVV